jgi:hypothetical protein
MDVLGSQLPERRRSPGQFHPHCERQVRLFPVFLRAFQETQFKFNYLKLKINNSRVFVKFSMTGAFAYQLSSLYFPRQTRSNHNQTNSFRGKSMKKLLLAGVVGGVIMFVWAMLYWAVLGIGSSSMKNTVDETAVAATLKSNLGPQGVYVLPSMPASQSPADMDAHMKKYEAGPIAMIIYNPSGADPMMTGQLIGGLILNILTCLVAAWFLSRSTASTSSYFSRVAFCGMFGILVSLASHLLNWNWMGYPLDYITKWIVDCVIGFILAGLGIAAFIKPARQSAS